MPRIKIGLTTEAMLSEITRRRTLLRDLQKERKSLTTQLSRCEAKILAAGGSLLRGRGIRGGIRRPRNSMKLSDAMSMVMSKETPMSVAEIADAVRKIGYISNSASFKTIIYQTLAREKKFKKIGRGLYVTKG
jgi:hypothetical protein